MLLRNQALKKKKKKHGDFCLPSATIKKFTITDAQADANYLRRTFFFFARVKRRPPPPQPQTTPHPHNYLTFFFFFFFCGESTHAGATSATKFGTVVRAPQFNDPPLIISSFSSSLLSYELACYDTTDTPLRKGER